MKKLIALILLLFYASVVGYVFFGVLGINALVNFIPAMIFEIIGILALLFLIFRNIVMPSVNVGYLVPLIITTIVYVILVHLINIALLLVSTPIFVLVNLLVLFVYCVISIPMYCVGKR